MIKPERIVVFDWGGVILRICRSWKEGCERAGLTYDPALDTPEIAEQRHSFAKQYEVGAIDAERFLHSVAETMGGRYSAEDIRRVHKAWLIGEYPGAPELLNQLADLSSVDTGLLSNTNHLHWIEHLHPNEGGTGTFSAIRKLRHRHASHLLGLAKPDPRIFAEFEERVRFSAEQIVYFDDLPANVNAARERGWDAVQVDHAGDTAHEIRAALTERGILPAS